MHVWRSMNHPGRPARAVAVHGLERLHERRGGLSEAGDAPSKLARVAPRPLTLDFGVGTQLRAH